MILKLKNDLQDKFSLKMLFLSKKRKNKILFWVPKSDSKSNFVRWIKKVVIYNFNKVSGWKRRLSISDPLVMTVTGMYKGLTSKLRSPQKNLRVS